MIIDKIHELNRFGISLGLERMNALMDRLGNPERELAVIHIAGTNGKGSVLRFIEEGLISCGYNVGSYTSPFLEKFNERIKIDGKMISDEDLEIYGTKVLAACTQMVEEGEESPTEFEVVTAIAFLYFKEKKTEIILLEVGLGGDGDSTNIIREPLLSIITSISYDHMDRLGNSLSEIAKSKAGIIKKRCPTVSNVSDREAAKEIARAAYYKGSILYDVSRIRPGIRDRKLGSQIVGMEIYEKDYSDISHKCRLCNCFNIG